jgi:hypothetical protein
MMKNFSGRNLLILLILSNSLFFVRAQDMPIIYEHDVPGFSLDRNETFKGRALWGYMNGGADIYLEYDVKVLRVEEFSREGENIKLELFKMLDPISAFGIYSIKTFKCEQSGVLIAIDCLNDFQYQLLYGEYYIQFSNESGTDKARQFMRDLAYALLIKIKPAGLAMPVKYFTDSLDIGLTDIKMLKGELGLQNHAHELSGYFQGLKGYQIFTAKVGPEGADRKYYEIVFNNAEMKKKFLENIEDLNFQILSQDDFHILGILSR